MQDMTCPQCKENVPLDKFRGDSENGIICVSCSAKEHGVHKPNKKPKTTKN